MAIYNFGDNFGVINIDSDGIHSDGAIGRLEEVVLEVDGQLVDVLKEFGPIKNLKLTVKGGYITSKNLNITVTNPTNVDSTNGNVILEGNFSGSINNKNGNTIINGDSTGTINVQNGNVQACGNMQHSHVSGTTIIL